LTAFIPIVFVLVYAGMALGRVPGLSIDRTGIALVGAVALVAAGAMPAHDAFAAIDFPTLAILFGLMVLSAQFALGGFYDWCALRLSRAGHGPMRLLAVVVLVSGGLSAVLANDVVAYAMTPMLCRGLLARGLDPRPYLIALAGAANAGSAGTLIGNPQNILIGQVGGLDFWRFMAACGVPALLGLACVFATVGAVWRGRLVLPGGARDIPSSAPPDRRQTGKALAATAMLLVLFATPLPTESGVLVIAAALMLSRRLTTRSMLGMVDWPLLLLFACLFIVTGALEATGLPAHAVALLAEAGLLPDTLAVLAPLSLAASNTIGNVPAVVLLLAVWPSPGEGALFGLAALATLAGNLLLVGSLANLIVVERAKAEGVVLGFMEHARCGIPMTLLSMALATGWLALAGWMPVR
jgi:Na+/H+ antiporter NhaD/arsenite permease-like protein